MSSDFICKTLAFLVFIAACGTIAIIATSSSEIPDVYTSWTTKQCVKVVPSGSCDNLPKKFDVVWVR